MFIQGCATTPGTNHAPEWLSPLETETTTYGCGAKYGNCQARRNMHIWRRTLHQENNSWLLVQGVCKTDRQTEGPLSFAVSAVKTQSPLTIFFSSLK